ncbi:MAG: hypothetical protein WC441_02005 [Patescibacteria group bacterium]
MFSNKDYRSYLKQLYAIEIDMEKEINDLIEIIQDKRQRRILESIRQDEIRHTGIVRDLLKLI